jgi:hypothetical protein
VGLLSGRVTAHSEVIHLDVSRRTRRYAEGIARPLGSRPTRKIVPGGDTMDTQGAA